MSCLGPEYNPVPTRVWSRVQNRCSQDTSISENVYIPQLKKTVSSTQVAYQLQMLQKGNILQYKGNSSRLTKSQRYSKIAQGKWINRNISWASQSEEVTIPNTTSLKRVNVKGRITLDGTPTTLPLTNSACNVTPNVPIKIPASNTTNNNSNTINPVKPPKPLPTPNTGGPNVKPFPPYIPPVVNPVVIQDGGVLICTTQVNPCTGKIINKSYVASCNLTTASDVPGTIQPLCYNNGLPTHFPRQRYIMTNSTNKWPEGAKFFASANATPNANKADLNYKNFLLS